MENRVVVEAAVHVIKKVLGTDRRLDRVQFDFDLAVGGFQQNVRRLGRGCSHQVGSKQYGAGDEGDFFQHGSVILSGVVSTAVRNSSSVWLKRSGWSSGVA